MRKYLIIILCTISGISFAQLPLKTLEKADSSAMYIGVDAADSLATWKPLSGIGYSTLADSSKWTVSGTYLFPKKLTFNMGLGLNNPAQQLELTGSFRTPATTSATTGVWYKGTTPFIHDYKHPTGGGAIPEGRNTFLGVNAGNFTMGSTATQTYESSHNVGIGYLSLYNNTKGYGNMAMGSSSLYNNSTGFRNLSVGYQSLFSNSTGHNNTATGNQSAFSNTIGTYNTIAGSAAFYANVDGSYNSVIGFNAGRYLADGSTTNITGDYNIYIGQQTRSAAANSQKEIVIGDAAIGNGSNTMTLGGSNQTKTLIPYGNVGIGTTAPTANLHIVASTGTNPRIRIGDADLTNPFTSIEGTSNTVGVMEMVNTGSGGLLHRGYSVGNSISGLVLLGSIGSENPIATVPAVGFRAGKLSGTSMGNLGTSETAFQFGNSTGATAYMTILGSGNVGIGTTAPTAKLHIAGDLKINTTVVGTSDTLLIKDGNTVKYRLRSSLPTTIDSTTVVNSYGTTITESPANQFNIKVDTSKIATLYDLTQLVDNDTQDLSIDSTGRVFTISLTNGGTVKFEDKDTDTNTTYTAGYGLDLVGTEFKADTSELATQYDLTQINFIDSTTVVNAYGTTITQSPANQFNITVDTSKIATQYDLTQIVDNDTQDLSIDSTGRVFTIGLTNGGSVKFLDTDTQLNESQVDSYVSNNGYLTTEVDGSVSNEGSLSVAAGSSSTSIINSNTSGSTGVTIEASTGLSITETSSKITLTNSSPNVQANLTFSGSASPFTLNSSDGTDVTFAAGTGIGLGLSGQQLTITNTSSGITGSGANTQVPYFTGTSTLGSNAGLTYATSGSLTATGQSPNYLSTITASGSNGAAFTLTKGTNYSFAYTTDAYTNTFAGFYSSATTVPLEIRSSTLYKRFEYDQQAAKLNLYKADVTGNPTAQVPNIVIDAANRKMGINNGSTVVYGNQNYLYADANGVMSWATPTATPPTTVEKYYELTPYTVTSTTNYAVVPLGTLAIDNSVVFKNPSGNWLHVTQAGYYEFTVNCNIQGGSATGAAAYLKIMPVSGAAEYESIEKIHQYPSSQAWQNVTISSVIYMTASAPPIYNKAVMFAAKATTGQTFIIDNMEITIKRVY